MGEGAKCLLKYKKELGMIRGAQRAEELPQAVARAASPQVCRQGLGGHMGR